MSREYIGHFSVFPGGYIVQKKIKKAIKTTIEKRILVAEMRLNLKLTISDITKIM